MATAKPLASPILCAAMASAVLVLGITSAEAAPPIRTSESNQVPVCVTPERLMAFLGDRNPRLDPRFREIARWYKYYGEGWRVRWDYAFFQMALETNFLSYRRGDGRRGDVWETQNNFAGIGATGGGVRGERFPDVKTGVHAQIQHLVAYSGEHLVAPIAKRTRENQDDIIKLSNRLGRSVTFGDLARRWATDRAYAKSIDFVANLFAQRYCTPPAQAAESDVAPPEPLQIRREWRYPFRPPSGLGGPKPEDLADPVAAKPASKKKQASKSTKPGKTVQKSKKTTRVSHERKSAKSTWSAATVIKPDDAASSATPTAVAATAPAQPVAQVAAASESSGFLPWLPTFHIAPETPEPSRLGGPLPADLGAAAKAAAQAQPSSCKVLTASYGGHKTLLIRSRSGAEVQFTALTIIDGFERPMFEAYQRTEAVGAEIVGEYEDLDAALADARVNCPDE